MKETPLAISNRRFFNESGQMSFDRAGGTPTEPEKKSLGLTRGIEIDQRVGSSRFVSCSFGSRDERDERRKEI